MSEYNDAYWRKVGWMANKLDLPPDSTDHEVLERERMNRACAQGLTVDSTWFSVFCAELKAGVEVEVPSYCELKDNVNWACRPAVAFGWAKEAHRIFGKTI